MIHPATSLRFVSDEIGYGVFANEFIPKGTITYVRDPLEAEISPDLFEKYSDTMKEAIEKYSYRDERGVYILSWDFGKYVNHCCNCNTMSTGYGFEIAIRDIQPGEELTDEYGLFNIDHEMQLTCNQPNCRMRVSPTDLLNHFSKWDQQVQSALELLNQTGQPLLELLDPKVLKELEAYLSGRVGYRSVKELLFVEEKQLTNPLK